MTLVSFCNTDTSGKSDTQTHGPEPAVTAVSYTRCGHMSSCPDSEMHTEPLSLFLPHFIFIDLIVCVILHKSEKTDDVSRDCTIMKLCCLAKAL